MKRLFVATSFSGHVDYETGQVNPEFRKSIEETLDALRSVGGFAVFCAVEYEGWVISDVPPEVGVEKDLEEIEKCDVFLALLHGAVSAGVQYETGYADAKEKQVIVATPSDTNLSYFNQGAVNLGRSKHVRYDSPELLAAQVKKLLI